MSRTAGPKVVGVMLTTRRLSVGSAWAKKRIVSYSFPGPFGSFLRDLSDGRCLPQLERTLQVLRQLW
jgi:hypothetical protein